MIIICYSDEKTGKRDMLLKVKGYLLWDSLFGSYLPIPEELP